MNKKFSTLVAAAMLTTSIGAFAADELKVSQKDFKSGSTYFLTTSADAAATTQALVVEGAELKRVPWTDGLATSVAPLDIDEMTKAEREYAMWTVTSKKVTSTVSYYVFTNKATGQKLQVSTTVPNAAFTANGVSQFENWITVDPASSTAIAIGALENTAGANKVVLLQAYVIGDKDWLTSTSTLFFAGLAESEMGKSQTRLMESIPADDRKKDNITALSKALVGADAITLDELTAQKAAIVKVDALLASLSLKRASLTAYDTYAKKIEALNAATTSGAAAGILSAQTAGAKALTDVLEANDYGWKITAADKKISGVVYAAKGAAIALPSTTYAKGTIFVSDFKVLPALMPETAFESEAKVGAIGTATVKDVDAFSADFVREFKKGNQADKDVFTSIGFDGPKATTNVLANQNIQVVKRNMLIDKTTGHSVMAGAALVKGDFKAATLIMNGDGKYLVAKTATYEPGVAASSYFKLEWADLDKYSDKDMTMTEGTTYSKAKGNLPASYIFDVKYDMNNDSLTIMPAFIIKKTSTTAAADTVGTSFDIKTNVAAAGVDNAYVLSLKQFSNSIEMTVVMKGVTLTDDSERTYRINTGATAPTTGWEITSKPSDVYFIQYISALAANKEKNEKFFTADHNLVKGSVEALNCIPSAQWALVKDASGVVTIKNRATNDAFATNGKPFTDAQLYKAGGELVSVYMGDTLKLTPVASNFKTDSTLGYFAHDAKLNTVKRYQLTYFNELDATKKVGYTKDSVMFVDKKGEGMWFQVVPVKDETKEFGADAIKDVSKKLKKSQYTLFTKMNGKQYNVVYNEKNNMFEISAATSDEVPATFYIKEMMHADKHWSVLENVDPASQIWNKVSVNDNTLELFGEKNTEVRTSMFALTGEDAPIYRRLGATIADGIAKNDTAYVEFFKADEPTRFLFENTVNKVANNSTGIAKDSLNFLGMYNKADFKVNASIFVDTAYVRNDTIKPLYMLAVDTKYVPSEAVKCPICGLINCPHHKDVTKAYTAGRYLVALHDSVAVNASAKYQGNTRLAFVPAKHVADTLVINNSIYTGVKGQFSKDSLIVLGENMTNATFAFRLVNENPADFYIESAPVDAAPQYVRIHNGIPVLVSELADAAIFNVTKTTVRPTDNEENAINTVSVVATDGAVIINNAAGKTVMISNMLGQTIAQTVITSDNATIAVPAGIAVVAVEGEKAVKAVVR